MKRMKHLKGHCQACGGHIEFPAEGIGTTAECPHCSQATELLLAAPPEEPTIPRRTIIWTGVTVLLLLLGLGGAILALKRAEQKAIKKESNTASLPAAPAPLAEPAVPVTKGFTASAVTLQKSPGSSVVYAVGTLTNASSNQRFGVKVLLDLLDANGKKLGQATDYQQVMEPNGQWHFKALVVERKAVSASVATVHEER